MHRLTRDGIRNTHTNADGDSDLLVAVHDNGIIDSRSDALRNLFRFMVTLHQHQKFLTTPATAAATLAQKRKQNICNRFQHRISELMPVCIVQLFEIVDVEKDDRRITGTFTGKRVLNIFINTVSVEKPRQGIMTVKKKILCSRAFKLICVSFRTSSIRSAITNMEK